MNKPRIAVLLGDPSGVGPEMAVKLLARERNRAQADLLLIADGQALASGQAIADQRLDPDAEAEPPAEVGQGVRHPGVERRLVEPGGQLDGRLPAEHGLPPGRRPGGGAPG